MSKAHSDKISYFPKRVFVTALIAVIVNILIVGFIGWQYYYDEYYTEKFHRDHDKYLFNIGRIMLLDEMITTSARMAAVSSDLKHIERYNNLKSELDMFIQTTTKMLQQAGSEIYMKDIEEANNELVKMEQRAFSLVKDGQSPKALAILDSIEYSQHKQSYNAGIEKILNILQSEQDKYLNKEKVSNLFSLLMSIIGVIVILIVWITLIKTTRQWLSERNKTENELRSLKQQIEFILGATKIHLDIIDSNFNIRYIDPGWQKIYGEPIGKKCYEYFMGTKQVCPGCGIVKALETKTVSVTEEILPKENNRLIQVTTMPYQDEKGEWLVAEANVDITERKQIEEALKSSEEKYRSLVDNLTVGIFRMAPGPQRKFIEVNSTIARMFGYESKEEFLKTSVSDHHQNPNELEILDRKITQDSSLINEELKLKKKDGTPIMCSMRAKAVYNKDGQVEYADGVIEDITELRRLQKELEDERKNLERTVEVRTKELRESMKQLKEVNIQLKEADMLKSKFLSTMSHELRTPMNAVIGFTDLLANQFFGSLNEKQINYLKQIDSSSKHLLALIDNLLDITRIDAGSVKVELEPLALEDSIQAIAQIFKTQLNRKNVKLQIECEPTAKTIRADNRIFRQILFNLISNAIKYSPDDSSIIVRALRMPDKVFVSITDMGIGIEPEDQEKLFNEFYQVNRSRDESLGGLGIGLNLVKRLVKLHGGEIGVESEPGKGSTFWFTIPQKEIVPEKIVKPVEEIKREPEKKLERRRILVAEDNQTNLDLILEVLCIHNHQVSVAKNGQEVLNLIQSFNPELIIMDIRMPVINGLEATRKLRQMLEFKTTPIIALTASAGKEAKQLCLDAGCTDYLAKPIQIKDLLDMLEKYLK